MPEYVTLDPEGKLTPESNAARQFLTAKVGRWRLVPVLNDLLVLRREQVQSGGPPVRAILTGDAELFPVGEMLAYLAQSRWTGVVGVSVGTTEKSIFIKRGAVRWGSSNLDTDRIGEVVHRLGMVAREDVDNLTSVKQKEHLGRLMVKAKLLTSADLYAALKDQMQEIFFSFLTMNSGVYFLFNDPVEARFPAQINLDLNGLLMEGLRRIDEFTLFKKRIPGPDAYVSKRNRDPRGLNTEERALLVTIDGRITVAQVAAASRLSVFDCTKLLYGLAEAGFVDVSGERPEAVLGAATTNLKPETRDILRVFNLIFREIFKEIGPVESAEFRMGANTFLESDQHDFREVFRFVGLDTDGMLAEKKLLENLAALDDGDVPDKAQFLYDCLNELMFFELFQAGETLPLEQDEELSRRVKVIYEMLET